MNKNILPYLNQFSEIACRLRPRRGFLSVLNRVSQTKNIQNLLIPAVGAGSLVRAPKCLGHFSETLTASTKGIL